MTYNGISFDAVELDEQTSDEDIKRIAAEIVSSGQVAGLEGEDHDMVTSAVFDNYIVDRLSSLGGVPKLYLRPKVPFGADVLEVAERQAVDNQRALALAAGSEASKLAGLLASVFDASVQDLPDQDFTEIVRSEGLLVDLLEQFRGADSARRLLETVRGRRLDS